MLAKLTLIIPDLLLLPTLQIFELESLLLKFGLLETALFLGVPELLLLVLAFFLGVLESPLVESALLILLALEWQLLDLWITEALLLD